ncbi:hypothetical protein I5M27_14160 [Adhaeribacter sp. BT258]|uniref:Uncharacterized protein n=1 Tax=Adhaeribacter terrigena TaxID=2793070 RepID=A0ABS1C6D5_9BACT|nr:hypothetical protein [Adhaeribacter terrigena]MBK0404135.1 hypothetical protein [Adhaeribacter terrigena]
MEIKKFFNKLKHEAQALTGQESKDRFFCAEAIFPDAAAAQTTFPEARKRLFDINNWHDNTPVTTPFELYDSAGRKTTAEPQKGNFIKITLPGIPVENWVEITDLQDQPDQAAFTVHPCPNPFNNEKETQHFFVQETSSVFKVVRQGNKIIASETGRNEYINNQEEAGNRAALNTVIAEGGWAVFQKILWQNLADYWCCKDEMPS